MDRRTFTALLASAAASRLVGCATGAGQDERKRTMFYQGVGDQLTHWDVDVELGGKFQWWSGFVGVPASG